MLEISWLWNDFGQELVMVSSMELGQMLTLTMLVVHTLYPMTKGSSYMQSVSHKDMDRTYTNRILLPTQRVSCDIDGYDETAFAEDEKFETEKGRFFNQNWATC